MEFRDTPAQAAFRAEVRTFIEQELPAAFRERHPEWGLFNVGREGRFPLDALGQWRRALVSRGWIVPAWPKQYGGAGLTVVEQFIFNEEMAVQGAPQLRGIGGGWAGPTILLYGTDGQKRRFLPGILSGEEIWCQGFSEPGAGSDLAALQTRAVRDGDVYVVNGQKIWTSLAHRARWMILLARTDPDAPKHKGISYFLLDMKLPGITIRPLVNMLGSHEFNEVFFEEVRVPADCLLGEENRGWYMAATTLDFERSNIATSVSMRRIADDMIDWACAHRRGLPPLVRYELAERLLETEVARLMSYRIVSMQARGLIPNREASVAKFYVSELDQRLARTGMQMLGLYGQVALEDGYAPLEGRVPRHYMHAVSSTIGGGTSEIQRGIIAMRGLGMPRG